MKKQIGGGVLLSVVAQAVSIIIGLLYTPIMIRALGQNEYGLYQLVQSVVNYLNLMNFGFSGAYIRYYSLAKIKDEKEISNTNGMFLCIFSIISILCIIVGMFFYFNTGIFGKNLTPRDTLIAKKLVFILVLNMAFSFPNSLFVSYMSAREMFVFQKLIGVILNILTPLFTIPLLYYGFGSIGVVLITLLLTIVRFALNAWYCFFKLGMKISICYFNKTIFKSLMKYTFFIFLSDVVDQMNSNVDKFLLGRISGTIAVAIYSLGFNLKNYYTSVSWIVPEMFIPEVNRLAIGKKDDEKLTKLFTSVGAVNNYIILLVLSGFFIFGKSFIRLWVGLGYEDSFYVAVVLMIAGYVPAIQTLGVNIQNAKNLHKVRSIVYFFVAVFNVISSIFLIKKYGVIGASIGTLVAVLLGNGLFMNIYYHKKVGIDVFYFWKKILRWFIIVLILTIVADSLIKKVQIESWIELFMYILAYVFTYIVFLWILGLQKEDKRALKSRQWDLDNV